MANYAVIDVDLTVAHPAEAPFTLAELNARVTQVQVRALPAPGAASLVIGTGKQPIVLRAETEAFNICPGENEGVYVINVAGAGVATFLVSYADSLSAVGA